MLREMSIDNITRTMPEVDAEEDLEEDETSRKTIWKKTRKMTTRKTRRRPGRLSDRRPHRIFARHVRAEEEEFDEQSRTQSAPPTDAEIPSSRQFGQYPTLRMQTASEVSTQLLRG